MMEQPRRRLTRRAIVGGAAGLTGAGMLGARAQRAAAQATPEVVGTVQVGLITSQSGPLQSYGEQYLTGFAIGLDYATGGTGVANGYQIETTIRDDGGVPDTAVAAARDLIGQGFRILGGSVVSGVGLQVAPIAEQNQVLFISGPAATDGLTGINPYTFRSGRQTYQDILTAASFLDTLEGQNVLVFAQDTAFGQANVAAVDAVFGAEGATVDSLLVAQDALDFAPFAAQILDRAPDLLFVAWAGATATAMYTSLDNQGVLESTRVVSGLDQRASYPIFGPAADQISFLSHYIYQAPNNEANQYLIDRLAEEGTVPDLFMPDGFSGAQMVVRAVGETGGEDVDAMIAALEGFAFPGPKGDYTVRPEDHAMLQPMFQVRLVQDGDEFEPEPITTLSPEAVAPPIQENW
ncbi:MAG: substrate-binding domain-containing protein [Chloroflexota bacterium]|nr:substrate-binding domain-containing protein [Chloroflexota bacterium]